MAAQHRSCSSAGEAGYRWIDDLNGATLEEPLPTGVGAVPLNINGGTTGGPWRRVPAARDGPHQPHPADQHPGWAGADDRRPGRRRRVRRTRRRHRSGRRSNRVVRGCNWFGTSADAVRRRPAGRAAGGGSAGGGGPARRCGVCGSSGMGAAGGLVGQTHGLPPLEAVLTTDVVSRSGPTQPDSARWSAGDGTIQPTGRTSVSR